MLTFLLLSLTIPLTFGDGSKYSMLSDVVKEHFIKMLANDECTSSWPDVQNCHEWFIDTEEGLNYVLTNDIPPYYVAPYCPFGPGKGYCLPSGATNCSEFYGLVCPAQAGAPPEGDVEVAQIQLYGFPLHPNPTNSTRPLNLYQLNPLIWYYDPWNKSEVIVDGNGHRKIPLFEKDLFNINNVGNFAHYSTPNVSNPAYQQIGVHLAGMQIKGPAEADGYNVDVVGIPLVCGGHVTPPVAIPPEFHYHKASFCLMEYDKKYKKKEYSDNGNKKEIIMSSFEKRAHDLKSSTHSDLVAFANDGFGIYGFYDISGVSPLVDECNGHFGCLDDECKDVTYHYHAYNHTYIPPGTYHPYWTGCLGPSKGICNTTVHQQYDNGANWCGQGCGYQICVQPKTNNDNLNKYIASFGDPNWLNNFTINPF